MRIVGRVITTLLVAAGGIVAFASIANADPQLQRASQDRSAAFMRVFGVTQPPHGFVRFCEASPAECVPGRVEEQRFNATPERMRELDAVNRRVNREIEPATDLDVYGETEIWAIPTVRGDCEDYALLKRQLLIRAGWPIGALLMTVVRDEKGEGHAVLTARTQQGDFVLDNKTDELKPWHKTGYTFLMRQSYLDPRIWMSLDAKEAASPFSPLAGVRNGR